MVTSGLVKINPQFTLRCEQSRYKSPPYYVQHCLTDFFWAGYNRPQSAVQPCLLGWARLSWTLLAPEIFRVIQGLGPSKF